MQIQSLKVAVTAISLVAFSVACSHKNGGTTKVNSSTGKADAAVAVEKDAQDNASKLTQVFTAIDPSYDFNNRSLTDKIEGLDLTSVYSEVPTISGVGYVKASILVKGVDQPADVTSDAVSQADLKAGKLVALKVTSMQAVQALALGGPVVGSLKCLDSDCKEVAVYFRGQFVAYGGTPQGAGYIFAQSDSGYKIENSIGPAVSIAEAQTVRDRKLAALNK